jgi:hypothetical protein
MTTAWRLTHRQVRRIGVLKLYQHVLEPDRCAVSLDNRTYHNFYEIPPSRLAAWRREFGLKES